MDGSVLTRGPADCDEFVELGFFDEITLVTIIGIADAILESCDIDFEAAQVFIEFCQPWAAIYGVEPINQACKACTLGEQGFTDIWIEGDLHHHGW